MDTDGNLFLHSNLPPPPLPLPSVAALKPAAASSKRRCPQTRLHQAPPRRECHFIGKGNRIRDGKKPSYEGIVVTFGKKKDIRGGARISGRNRFRMGDGAHRLWATWPSPESGPGDHERSRPGLPWVMRPSPMAEVAKAVAVAHDHGRGRSPSPH
ncbi:hypothetical protein Salat_0864500 [Sesamum alatum]|uniref:Uncharacterized protein n=1 Tax=Sesamum alatum TaxID=300844 RepID=A0AAE1YIS1_9LAMI|nr:hypothetical protein Salat_0864500 [Sesamum alatum]